MTFKELTRWSRPSTWFRAHAEHRGGLRVASGPFTGMRFVSRSVWGAHVPKLAGTYERELHDLIEAMIARRPRLIVDVGAAEGYYAVGLATRLPEARVIAFDQMESARRELASLAAANAVGDRISIEGSCAPGSLERALAGEAAPAVVCDVEGFEDVLIDPAAVPSLRRAAILVELHDTKAPGVTGRVTERFAATHDIVQRAQVERHADEYVLSRGTLRRAWPAGVVRYALNEFRTPGTSWAWMVPRAPSA
jgi:hypothetical protein